MELGRLEIGFKNREFPDSVPHFRLESAWVGAELLVFLVTPLLLAIHGGST
jgi:hypothetical protein